MSGLQAKAQSRRQMVARAALNIHHRFPICRYRHADWSNYPSKTILHAWAQTKLVSYLQSKWSERQSKQCHLRCPWAHCLLRSSLLGLFLLAKVRYLVLVRRRAHFTHRKLLRRNRKSCEVKSHPKNFVLWEVGHYCEHAAGWWGNPVIKRLAKDILLWLIDATKQLLAVKILN